METTQHEAASAATIPFHSGEYVRPSNLLRAEAELAERDLARVLKKNPATPTRWPTCAHACAGARTAQTR